MAEIFYSLSAVVEVSGNIIVFLLIICFIFMMFQVFKFMYNTIEYEYITHMLFEKIDLDTLTADIEKRLRQKPDNEKVILLYVHRALSFAYKKDLDTATKWMRETSVKMQSGGNVSHKVSIFYELAMCRIAVLVNDVEEMKKIIDSRGDFLKKIEKDIDYASTVKFINLMYAYRTGNLEESKTGFDALLKESMLRLERLIVLFTLAEIEEKEKNLTVAIEKYNAIQTQRKIKRSKFYVYKEIEERLKSLKNQTATPTPTDKDEVDKVELIEKTEKELEMLLEKEGLKK